MGKCAFTFHLLTLRHHVFHFWFQARNLIYVTSPQKRVTYLCLVLKDSDAKSENLNPLIWLSVSDHKKTDSSKYVSFIGI